VSHDQEAGCGEEAFLAERSGAARSGIRSGVLPAAPVKGESVLLVAAQAQGRSTGTDIAQARNRPGSGELCAGQRRTGATDAGASYRAGDGRRLRIRKGVDEETLRAVLAPRAIEMLSFRRPAKVYLCTRYRATMRRSFDGLSMMAE